MKFTDLRCNKHYVLESLNCVLPSGGSLLEQSGRIEDAEGDALIFITELREYRFVVNDIQDRRLIKQRLKSFICLGKKISVDNKNNQNHFALRIVFFSHEQRLGNLNILIPHDLEQKLKAKFHAKNSYDLFQSLAKQFMLEDMGKTYFIFGSYDNKSSHLDKAKYIIDNADSEDTDSSKDESNATLPLVLYGAKCIITVRLEGHDFDQFLRLEKINYRFNNLPCFSLGIGTITFSSEIKYTGQKIREILEDNSTYLTLWNLYAAKEGEFLLNKARNIGLLHLIRKSASLEGGNLSVIVKFEQKDGRLLLRPGDSLAFYNEKRKYLFDQRITWEDWQTQSGLGTYDPDAETLSRDVDRTSLYNVKRFHEAEITRKIVKIIGDRLVIEGTEPLPDRNFVSFSIKGDEIQITRRAKCRENIRTGNVANPSLALIIEGIVSDLGPKKISGKHIDPMSALVLDKIFQHPPTPTQKRAIDIALNTPDIAIIQGPPGTGKTTVVTAIIERLNELADKKDNIYGDVLVSCLQHDAVLNIQERLSVNSLPPIKFGKSSKQKQENAFDLATEQWCRDQAQMLRAKHTSLKQTEQEEQFQALYHTYMGAPNYQNALAFLNYARTLPAATPLDPEITSLIDKLNLRADDKESQEIILAIRRLRTEREAFLDDGAQNAMQLYVLLEKKILDQDHNDLAEIFATLRLAANAKEEDVTLPLLATLKKLQDQLLERCIPLPFYREEMPLDAVTAIYNHIKPTLSPRENAEDAILYSYLYELEHNLNAVRKALQKYCFVFTATLQQSQGAEISLAKKDSEDRIEYDTVIVDEAARANPGDLLLPLTQAKNRIILVGDHRQLPHMYDEEIFEELHNSGTVLNENDIKTSMFEHLLKKAKKLQNHDGIKRFITLDAQYRMHPLLGQFVSDQFYAQYGEGFTSPLNATHFAQNISESPVRWLNLPPSAGSEKRNTAKSRYRECEADVIFERLEHYLNDPTLQHMSYGVISFYSAQVHHIQNLFAKKGSPNATKALENGRLRIGSVDSFQGMEFDVIFLSIVRSGHDFKDIDLAELARDVSSLPEEDAARKQHEAYVTKIGMQLYGFLTSENRLCVSLSRQKKLLLVVGDKSMFVGGKQENVAKICVPSIPALYHLCEQLGAVDECRS